MDGSKTIRLALTHTVAYPAFLYGVTRRASYGIYQPGGAAPHSELFGNPAASSHCAFLSFFAASIISTYRRNRILLVPDKLEVGRAGSTFPAFYRRVAIPSGKRAKAPPSPYADGAGSGTFAVDAALYSRDPKTQVNRERMYGAGA